MRIAPPEFSEMEARALAVVFFGLDARMAWDLAHTETRGWARAAEVLQTLRVLEAFREFVRERNPGLAEELKPAECLALMERRAGV